MALEEKALRIVQWPEQHIKLCVSLCEPICVQSDYTIGIDVFDRPVASITVRGMTKLFNCAEKVAPPSSK
jgi:hypothetical protein